MNPSHIIMLKILLFGLVGYPFACIFDKDGYFFFLTKNVSDELVVKAYLWTIYAFVTMGIMYFALGVNRRIKKYQHIVMVPTSTRTYMRLWVLSFIAALVCLAVLFVQAGYSHPGFSAINMDMISYAIMRIEIAQRINANIYNIGLKIFTAFSLTIAMFLLRNFWLSAASIILFVVLATYSLAKSPMADTIVLLLFVYLLINRPSWRFIFSASLIIVLVGGLMYFMSGGVSDFNALWIAFTNRVIYGQFADLPYYLDLFAKRNIDLTSMFPPYIQSLFGDSAVNASRLVVEYTNPDEVLMGAAGVANTVFIGEAYAWAGVIGVILAPFWVVVHFFIVTLVFTSLKKDIYKVFIFGYLLYRMTEALFGGFSYFIFSGIHIMLAAFLYTLIINLVIKRKKGIINYRMKIKIY